jgi:hypothetical protein
MVKAVLPEDQFGGGYSRPTAEGELKSRIGKLLPLMGGDNKSAFPSHPQSSGLNERMGHLNTTKLNHVETQDCLSW